MIATTGFGQLISSFTRTQVAAVFATAILSIVPAVNFSGLFAPVSSLSGGPRKVLGLTFPSAWYQPITVGVFAKALGMSSLWRTSWRSPLIAVAYLGFVAFVPSKAGGVRCLRFKRLRPARSRFQSWPRREAVTLRDHCLNIFRLVIKELRSIRSDPTMLILVVYAFSISVNTVATGAVTEATNLSVGIVDEDGSELSRQIAEGLVRPTFQPAVQITASEIDSKMNQGELLVVVEIPPNFQANVPRPAQDRDSNQRRCNRGSSGRQRRQLSQDRYCQRDTEFPHTRMACPAARPSTSSFAPISIRT